MMPRARLLPSVPLLLTLISQGFVAAAAAAPSPPLQGPVHDSSWLSVSAASDQDIASAFADLKAGSGPYAPARAAAEDWAAARTAVAGNARWATWIAKRRASLDEWLSAPRDDRHWVAGWLHDYVESATGAWLQWSPSTPIPPDDAGHARQRGGWIAHVRFHNVDEILEAARLFRLGQGEQYGRWAAAQLDEYAAAYPELPLQTWNGQSRLFTQSLDEAVGSLTMLEAVRLLAPTVDAEHRHRWRDGLFLPLAGNLRVSKRGDHNIAVWHAAAIAAIGMEFDRPELIADGLDGPFGVRQLLARNVSRDFFWAEMSIAYQDYVVEALGELFVAAALRGKLEGLRRELLIAQDLLISPTGIVFPDGLGPTLNDSPPNRKIPSQKLWSEVRRALPTRIALTQNARALDWATLIDPQPSPGPVEAFPLARTRLIPGLNAVQLVSPDWQAILRYGERVETHAQQESMTYELQYRGTWLLRDDGTVGYGSPLYQGFFKRAASQNVPLVDGDGQQPWPATGAVTAFSGADTAQPTATVEHVNYQPGVKTRRSLSLESGRFVDRIVIEAGRSADLGFVFNFDCELTPGNGLASRETAELPSGPFGYWQQTAAYGARAGWSASLACPGHRFQLSVTGPADQRVYIGRAPSSVKPYRRTGLLVQATGASASFVVTFAPES